jgi:hypothetical protein
MKKKKPNGQQFKSKMNKLSKNKKKVVHTPQPNNDSWESPGYSHRYVPGEHFNNWIDNRS